MRKEYGWLGLAAAAGAAAGIWGGAGNAALRALAPFVAAAKGLRALSLSGAAGDALAWALWAALGLAPLLGLLPRGRARGWADGLFALSAAYGLFYWYAMANPTLFLGDLAGAGEGLAEAYQWMLTGVLLALPTGAAALRLTEESGGTEALLRRAGAALYALMLLIAASAAFAQTAAVRRTLAEGALAVGSAAFRGACSAAVAAAAVRTLSGARALLSGMRGGWFAGENEALALSLSRRAKKLLAATVVCEIASNAAALLTVGRVPNASVTVEMPIQEFLLACAFLLLARFVRDGARLKRENESFI